MTGARFYSYDNCNGVNARVAPDPVLMDINIQGCTAVPANEVLVLFILKYSQVQAPEEFPIPAVSVMGPLVQYPVIEVG